MLMLMGLTRLISLYFSAEDAATNLQTNFMTNPRGIDRVEAVQFTVSESLALVCSVIRKLG